MVKYIMTPEQLKKWRLNHSYTQVKLAKVLGVTNVCISRWEIGMREIPSFLHLALECLEKKGGMKQVKGKKKTKKKKEVKRERL